MLFLHVLVEFRNTEHKQSTVEKFEAFTWKVENFSRWNKGGFTPSLLC